MACGAYPQDAVFAEKLKKEQEKTPSAAPSFDPNDRTLMPSLAGLSLRRTIEICASRGIIPTIKGSGTFILRQSPAPGTKLSGESSCTVWLTDTPPEHSAENKE